MKNLSLLRLALWVSLAALFPALLIAQEAKWESIGPDGGYIASVVRDAKNPDVLYAIPYGKPAPLFKSNDRGATWIEIGKIDERVSKLLINPFEAGSLYALSSGFNQDPYDSSETLNVEPSLLHESIDGGKTWTSKPFPPIYTVLSIAFDPKNPLTVHAVARTAMSEGVAYLKSTDKGEFWDATEIPGQKVYAASLAIDPLNPMNVYVSIRPSMFTVDTKVLFGSTDGGATFSPITVSRNDISPLNDVAIDPTVAGRLFALTYGGVYRSNDGGKSWQKNKGSLTYPQKIWIDSRDTSHLIVALDKGVAESNDGGVTWKVETAKPAGSGTNNLLVDARAGLEILTANSAGIFASTDLGKSWTPRHKGIVCTQVTAVRVAPSSPNTVFAALMSNAVYKTTSATSAAVAWEQLPVFYTCTNIADILVETRKPYRIYAMEGGG
jgi:photosystem II stability/assembly factor-like uncharacterized protein